MPVFSQPPGGMGIPVKAVRVTAQSLEITAAAVGSLAARESVIVRPEIQGRVRDIHFNEGSRVKKGEVLVSLDDSEPRAQLAAAEAGLSLARKKLVRAEDLVAKNFVSRQSLDEAQEAVKGGEAQVQTMKARLAKYRILAPFAGVMGLRLLSPGAYVKEGNDIAELADYSTLKLDVAVPQIFLPQVRVGLPLSVTVDAFPGQQFSGRVYAVASSLDPGTRTIQVRAHVDNAALKLRPGMFAKVTAQLGSKPRTLFVPEEAIVPKGRDSFVFRVVGGKAQMVKVTTGARDPGRVEIVQGLAEGDLVVTEGQIKLKPGAPVKAMVDPAAPGP